MTIIVGRLTGNEEAAFEAFGNKQLIMRLLPKPVGNTPKTRSEQTAGQRIGVF